MYLNANLVEIAVDEARRNVTELRFRSFNRDGSFAVKANCFILCLGGIENARLLLNAQIGNQHDLVGRNFCEHLVFTLGEALFKLQRPSLPKFLAPTPDFISRAAILNFNLRLRIPKSSQPARSYLRDMTCSPLAQSIAEKLSADFGCDVPGQLRVACEQALNPDSRVRLTDSLDRFGLRRVALDWRINDVDRKTIRTGAIEGARMLATQDVGRVRLLPWVLDPAMPLPTIDEDEVIGFHHMCTTRMSADPSQGVVDKDCRIHETENLYLGGSSVFATSGQANPTYTIVQLALRLADHLHHRLDGV
jgi:choline dehydrogenase-like flavoprotein